MDDRGIVVLGVARSGTTLVRRLLDVHPAIAAPPETTVLSAAARFLHVDHMGSGVTYGVLSGLETAGFGADEVLVRLRALVFGFLREHAARAGKPVWAEKTATDIFHLANIERLCGGEVRYVGVLRHGLDVAVSLLDLAARTGSYFSELHGYVQREPRPYIAMAQAWASATEALLDLAARRPEQVCLVRYETLVVSPEVVLEALASFLGISVPAGWVHAALSRPGDGGFGDWKTWQAADLHSHSLERWRTLDRALVAAAVQHIGPTLARAGYPLPETLSPEAAQRRAAFAQRLAVHRPGKR